MRFSLILATILAALGASPTWAQSVPTEPVFTADRMRAHVEFLADDLLEGRNAGTRGHEIAARYVASQFSALGLRPGGDNGSWFQRIAFAEYSLNPGKPASVTIGATRFANTEDVLIGATPRAGNEAQTVTGDAVFVGYGLESDYAGLNLTGKFAVMLAGVPAGLAGEERRAAEAVNKGLVAASHGAVGILYVVTPEGQRRMNWQSAIGYFTRSQFNWLGPNGAPGGVDSGVRTGAYVRGAAATALFAGGASTAEEVFAAAAQPGPVRGFALRHRVTVERTSKVEAINSPNVIGILPGSDPELADEYVLLMAHLDHEGVDTRLEGDQIYNGAMDNAGGTAAMLEAARGFAESGVRPKRSIIFVAVTAEEDGLLGSDYLAHYPVVGDGRVVGVVNLDMPILLYDFTDVVAFGAEHSTLGPLVEQAAFGMGVTLSPDPMPEENLFLRSDHYSFVKAGVPSVFLVTGFQNGGEAAFRQFLATDYHQVSDEVDLPFNWNAGAKFARINYLIARSIADAPDAPRWYEGNRYGEQYAPGQPRAPRPTPVVTEVQKRPVD